VKKIVKYVCDGCGVEYPNSSQAKLCERKDADRLKIMRRNTEKHKQELLKQNLSEWAEDDGMKTCERVDPKKFGPHKYQEEGTSDCAYGCGCWMGSCRSGGKVDPFGMCPKNPLAGEQR